MKKYLYIILAIILLGISIFIIYNQYQEDNSKEIPNNYIAVFKGENAEIVYKTYLYEKVKGKKKTYKYINTESKLSGYDSTNWEETITKKAKLKKINKIFEIAEKNNAYQEVKYQKDEQIYSVTDFKKILTTAYPTK